MSDENSENHMNVPKSKEVELLEELVAETKKSGEFTERYSYVAFCLTILAIMVGAFAVVYSIQQSSDNLLEFAVSGLIFGFLIVGAFWLMMRKPGWDDEKSK